MLALKAVWSEDAKTACVDGKTLRLNPKFVETLDFYQLVTLIAHEILHVAFNHISRSEGLNADVYNQAADHVINLYLEELGFTVIPGWLCDKQYRGMSTRQVYDLLMKNPKQQKPNPQAGDFSSIKGSAPDAGKQKQEIKEIITRANTAKEQAEQKGGKGSGKRAGSIPGEIEILIDQYLHPKLPWNVILQNYMNNFDKTDYSFKRPNKRFMPDYFLPSLYEESMSEIAVAFDVSGSVTDYELKQYISEVNDIIEKLNPERTKLITFDTKIQDVHVLEKGISARGLKFHGRGGTNLRPVFKHFENQMVQPEVLIVFSDLQCSRIPESQKPNYDVIWICVNSPRSTVEFGKLIHVDLGNEWDD